MRQFASLTFFRRRNIVTAFSETAEFSHELPLAKLA
jgi:hypothetical protein